MTNHFIRACLFAFTVLLFSGCSGEPLPPGIPKLYPATLTVIQDGKPLAGAGVILTNVDPSSDWSAGGATDQNGVLKLRTLGRYDGAPVGTYRVSVQKIIEDNTFQVVDPKFARGVTELEVEITPRNFHFTVDVGPAVRIALPPPPTG